MQQLESGLCFVVCSYRFELFVIITYPLGLAKAASKHSQSFCMHCLSEIPGNYKLVRRMTVIHFHSQISNKLQ